MNPATPKIEFHAIEKKRKKRKLTMCTQDQKGPNLRKFVQISPPPAIA
jgi:hypothetical protein